jgi:hypothetical protein
MEARKVEADRHAREVYPGYSIRIAARISPPSIVMRKFILPDDSANGPIAKHAQSGCHDTLPWLISFSLDALANLPAAFLLIGTACSRRGLIHKENVSTSLVRLD